MRYTQESITRYTHHDQDGDTLKVTRGPRGPLVAASETFMGVEHLASVYYSRKTAASLAAAILSNTGVVAEIGVNPPASAEECEQWAVALLTRADLLRRGVIS